MLLYLCEHYCLGVYTSGNMGGLMSGKVHCRARGLGDAGICGLMYRFGHWSLNPAINDNPSPAMYIFDR